MKLFRLIFSAACLIGISSLAQAGYSGSISGPTSLEVGEVGSFNVHITYTPYDLSILEAGDVDDRVQFSHYQTTLIPLLHSAAVGLSFLSGVTPVNPGVVYAPVVSGRLSGIRDFDASLPYVYDAVFTAVFATAGSFSIQLDGTLSSEQVYQSPSQRCLDLGTTFCDIYPLDALTDVFDVRQPWGANLTVAVTAVPEPESYAMMLVGLGLLGAVARRRKVS